MKVKTDATKSYFNAKEALADKGYTYYGTIIYGKYMDKKAQFFGKNEKFYYFLGMDNFNSTVYGITLGRVSDLKSDYVLDWDNFDK